MPVISAKKTTVNKGLSIVIFKTGWISKNACLFHAAISPKL